MENYSFMGAKLATTRGNNFHYFMVANLSAPFPWLHCCMLSGRAKCAHLSPNSTFSDFRLTV